MDKKELIKLQQEKKAAVAEIKKSLNELHIKKEALFREKEELNNHIAVLIKSIKESREQRNSFTTQVQEEKARRDEINKQIKDKSGVLNSIRDEKKNILSKHKLEDTSKLQMQIKKMEQSIETDALSFEKERGVMK